MTSAKKGFCNVFGSHVAILVVDDPGPNQERIYDVISGLKFQWYSDKTNSGSDFRLSP